MTELEKLLAKDQIRESIYLYSRCMDRCDNELCDLIFTENSELHYPPDFEGTGREFCAWAEGNHRRMYDYTSHQYTDVIIDTPGEYAENGELAALLCTVCTNVIGVIRVIKSLVTAKHTA